MTTVASSSAESRPAIATVGGWLKSVSRIDWAIALVLGALAFGWCYRVADWDPAQYLRAMARDVWFDADVNRVFAGETDRNGGTDRTTLHPLYSYLTYPPVFVLRRVCRLTPYTAARVFHSGLAAFFLGAFFGLMRRMRLRRSDAVVLTAAVATSAAGVFWLPATETFVIGSLSMFPALILATLPPARAVWGHWLGQTLSLGVTVTNWLISLIVSYLDLTRRAFVQVTGGALAVCLLGGYFYSRIFPESVQLFAGASNEAAFILPIQSGGPFAIMRTFFFARFSSAAWWRRSSGSFRTSGSRPGLF
jgi:hypothetical protein